MNCRKCSLIIRHPHRACVRMCRGVGGVGGVGGVRACAFAAGGVPGRPQCWVLCNIWSAIRVIWLLNSITGLRLRADGAARCGAVRRGAARCCGGASMRIIMVDCCAAWIPEQARGSTGPGHRRARVCGTGQGRAPMEHHFDAGASRLLCRAEGVERRGKGGRVWR